MLRRFLYSTHPSLVRKACGSRLRHQIVTLPEFFLNSSYPPLSFSTQLSLLNNENARKAANQAMSVAAWRMYPSLIHCAALVTASDAGIVLLFISLSIVGMKYVNVITLSTSTAAPAASHQLRTSFGATHAAARLANVSNVSGTVVT